MSIRRFSSRTHRLDASFLMQHLAGARSYKRIAGYFTSSLFEVAGEALEHIPEVKIVCNVDIHPDDLKVAQLRESKMLGRWNERALEAEALLNRERYRRLDAFLAKHGQAVRIAPDDICGFVHGKAGVITLADGRRPTPPTCGTYWASCTKVQGGSCLATTLLRGTDPVKCSKSLPGE